MTRITFQEISVKGIKRWTDADGKKRQKTRKFWQTRSPFNTNAAGEVKSYDEIKAELCAQRDAWLKEPAEAQS